jgi:iron complex transport system ATP-binding protein
MNPVLRAMNVRAGYRGHPVLDGVSMGLDAGEIVAILGPNGAGKSTLVRVLAGHLRPTSGCVRFGEHDLARRSVGWIARRIARSPQVEANDWPATVFDTVLLGRAARRGWIRPFDATDRAAVIRCLEETGLSAFADRRVTELSAGEVQRVLIARALAQEPNVLLLDEPTSHLDPKYQFGVLNLASSLARSRNLAVAIVLHDLEQAARWSDRVVILSGGRIIRDAAPHEALTAESLSAVYDIPIAVRPDADGGLRIQVRGTS